MLRRIAFLASLAGVLPAQDIPAGMNPIVLPQTQLSRNCSAEGVVVNSVTGEPIARAKVIAGTVTVSSDSSGLFRAQNIQCGPLRLTAIRVGFISDTSTAASARPVRTILTPGQTSRDNRIQLVPQSVVTGVVTDDQGDPVLRAQVGLYTSRVQQGRRVLQQSISTVTNDLGEFRLAPLTAGKYQVCAHLDSPVGPVEGEGQMVGGERCYPGPLDGGSTFDLAPGRDLRLPLSLPLVPAVHVRGTLTGLGKTRGASASLVRRGVQGFVTRAGAMMNDGKFEFRGITAGAYTVNVDYWEDNKRFTARMPLDVGSGNIDDLVVPVSQAFTINGTVRMETKDGSVPPRQQFAFGLRAAEPMAGGGRLVWNADNTAFTLADLSPGTYRLESYAAGNFFIKRARLNGRDISREDVPIMQPGGALEVVVSDEGGTLEGSVTDRDGLPQASWVMVLEEGKTPRMSTSDEAGNFRSPLVPPGNYTLYAWEDPGVVEYANPEWIRRYGVGEKVTVEAGKTARVKLIRQQPPR